MPRHARICSCSPWSPGVAMSESLPLLPTEQYTTMCIDERLFRASTCFHTSLQVSNPLFRDLWRQWWGSDANTARPLLFDPRPRLRTGQEHWGHLFQNKLHWSSLISYAKCISPSCCATGWRWVNGWVVLQLCEVYYSYHSTLIDAINESHLPVNCSTVKSSTSLLCSVVPWILFMHSTDNAFDLSAVPPLYPTSSFKFAAQH